MAGQSSVGVHRNRQGSQARLPGGEAIATSNSMRAIVTPFLAFDLVIVVRKARARMGVHHLARAPNPRDHAPSRRASPRPGSARRSWSRCARRGAPPSWVRRPARRPSPCSTCPWREVEVPQARDLSVQRARDRARPSRLSGHLGDRLHSSRIEPSCLGLLREHVGRLSRRSGRSMRSLLGQRVVHVGLQEAAPRLPRAAGRQRRGDNRTRRGARGVHRPSRVRARASSARGFAL